MLAFLIKNFILINNIPPQRQCEVDNNDFF